MGVSADSAAIVGRAPELATLAGALAAASQGTGAAVLVGGEAGIGKTRLVSEFADHSRLQGAAVLRGECLEAGVAGLPYGPVAQALSGAVSSGLLDPHGIPASVVEQLAILVPDLAVSFVDERSPFQLAGLGQVRLFEALLATIERLGSDRAVLLVVEDLHWADRSTLDLVTFLIHNVRATRCLLIVTVRTDAVERGGPIADALAELSRRSDAIRIDLRPFDHAETAAYLGQLLGAEPGGDVTDRIHRRSDGNPFFVEQLAWAHQDGEDTAVPPSLRDILLNQLSRQPAEVQALLGAAAIAGPRIDEELLAAMVERSDLAIAPALRRAVQAHLLVPKRDVTGESYPFRHALMAEAVDADLLEGERRRLHAHCADALEQRPPGDAVARAQWAARIAYHRDLAHDRPGLVAATLVAAEAAEAVAARQDALVQYRRALAALTEDPATGIPDGWDLAEIHVRAATCAAVTGQTSEAARLSTLALAHLPEDVDPLRHGGILVDHAEHLWLAGDPRFVEALTAAAAVVPAEPPSRQRADALLSLGFHHKYLGDSDEARLAWQEARTTARRAGATRVEALAMSCLAELEAEAGEVARALRLLDGAIETLRRAEPSWDTAVVYMDIAAIASWAGDYERSVEVAREGLAAAQRHGFETFYGGGLAANGAEALWALGRIDEAVEFLALCGTGSAGSFSGDAYRITRARIRISVGDLDGARADLDACADWQSGGDAGVGRLQNLALAEHAIEAGQPAAVEALVKAGLALPPGHTPWEEQAATLAWLWIRAAADLAESARARRDLQGVRIAEASGDEAMAVLDAILAGPLPAGSLGAGRARAHAALAHAEATRLAGHSDAAAWRAAQVAWQGHAYVLPPLYAQIREAEALLADGASPRIDGARLLRSAHGLAVTYGAAQIRRMIEGIARRARVELAPGTTHHTPDAPGHVATKTVAGRRSTSRALRPYGLTDRELEILALLAAGLTNRQIGNHLFISPKTAGVHVSNILGKLEVGSRTQAATMAHRLGLETVEIPVGS